MAATGDRLLRNSQFLSSLLDDFHITLVK